MANATTRTRSAKAAKKTSKPTPANLVRKAVDSNGHDQGKNKKEKKAQLAAPKNQKPEAVPFKKKEIVRDNISMSTNDYEKIAAFKKKCRTVGIIVKKNELLRAGLVALEQLSIEDLARTVGAVRSIKTGRAVIDRKEKKKVVKKQQKDAVQ